jgi:hypothetical protein
MHMMCDLIECMRISKGKDGKIAAATARAPR